jgi:hypothetical protein
VTGGKGCELRTFAATDLQDRTFGTSGCQLADVPKEWLGATLVNPNVLMMPIYLFVDVADSGLIIARGT